MAMISLQPFQRIVRLSFMARRGAGIWWNVNELLAGCNLPHFIVDNLAILRISGCGYRICQEMKIFGTTNHAQRTGSLNNS